MDVKDLVGYLKAGAPQLQVTEEDIRKPRFDTVFDVYKFLLCECLELGDSVLDQLPFNPIAQLENPEMYDIATPRFMLYKLLDLLIGDMDSTMQFTMQDIFAPNSKRTVYFLCLLIRFREEIVGNQRPVIEGIIEGFETKAADRQEMLARIDELKVKVNELSTKTAEQRQNVKLLEQEHRSLTDEIQKRTKLQSDLKLRSDKYENYLKSEEAAQNELDKEREKLMAEINYAEENLVTSPERLHQCVAQAAEGKAQKLRDLEMTRQHVAELKERVAKLTESRRRLGALADLQKNVWDQLEKRETSVAEKTRLVAEAQRLRHSGQDLQQQLALETQKLAAKEAVARKAATTFQSKLEELNKQRNKLNGKIEKQKKFRDQNRVAAVEWEENVEKLHKEMEDMKEQHEYDLEAIDARYKQLLLQVDEVNAQTSIFLRSMSGEKNNAVNSLDNISNLSSLQE